MSHIQSINRTGLSRRQLLQGAALGIAGLTLPRTVRAGGFVPTPNPADYVLKVGNAQINPDGEKTVPAIVAQRSTARTDTAIQGR